MRDLSITVTNLKNKIEKLVHLHKTLQTENHKLNELSTSLSLKVKEQQNTINQLEDKNKQIKLGKILTENNNKSTLDIKLKINELVREIDKCIALLNR